MEDDAPSMRQLLAEAGRQLGARPCPGGFLIDRGSMQLVASLQEGALRLDLRGSKKSQPVGAQGAAYRATSPQAHAPIEVTTIEAIVLRPLERIDAIAIVPGARRIEIGDEAYDVSTAIETVADRDVARIILAVEEVRKGVFHLLDRGFEPVELYAGSSIVRAVQPIVTPVMLELGPMRSVVDAVLSMGEALPVLAPRREGRLGWWRHGTGFAGFVALAMLLIALVAMKLMWSTLEPWELIGVVAGASVWGLSIPIVFMLYACRSDPLRSAARMLVPCFFAMPLAGADLLMFVNCGMDRSHMQRVQSRVTRMSVEGTKGRSYKLRFPSRRSPGVPRDAVVSEQFYRELERIPESNRAIEIDYYPGRLGLEYYTGMRVVRP